MNSQQASYVIEEELGGTDAEMASRLLRLKREPSPALVARIHGIPTASQRRLGHAPHWAWGMAAAVVLLAVPVVSSPPLRAAIVSLQETIGNVYLTITDRSPDTSDATIVEPELMSLQAARTAVPFPFGIPSQVPDGWVMGGQVRVNDLGGGPYVEIEWTNPGHGHISLFTREDDGSASRLVSPDSFREVELGGQPAVLLNGAWDHGSQEWRRLEVRTLIWKRDGVEYSLSASGHDLSEADLVAMAESTR
ncbi:MAG: hypothetical protein GX605_13095 [Chloroflexi bacterium]|nr:hypothetical protein [Chloroflexota bacterium]